MHINLSDNIRAFRKARSLTQEQLAEALGVTVGAVYKWEAKLSTPDINLIVELADLFDTSVDVLLGYEVKNNKQKAMVERMKSLMQNRDERALTEAEKALIRYPNCFDIVYQSATLYHMFGLINRDKKLRQRAIRLMERAILLINQNTDPTISELSIYINMADCYFTMDEAEKAVELLKSNNPCGINDALIGQILASACDLPQEAVPYLSIALLNNIASFTRIVMGYSNVYFKRREFASAVDILRATLAFFEHFREPKKSNFLDRMSALFYICLAHAQIELGETDAARESLCIAKSAADDFDRMPNYKGNSIRFVSVDAATAFDDLGSTAKEAVLNLIQDIKSEALSALWEEIDHAG
ncbi:MAG: helix-turn-helix transcriptional regulator [Lachnospiraceae bacterium]|nr:helix-turn-helix transcriptional regulator [Lachnospiraceae bacterium]